MFTFASVFKIVVEVLAMAIRAEKERNLNWRRKVIMPLFTGGVILYTENPKDTTRKLLEIINEFINEWRVQNKYTEISCIPIP